MTKKLYLDDAYLKEFTAGVVRCEQVQDGFQVVLDQTAFYAESGGQPDDRGLLGGSRVLKVTQAGDEILHLLHAAPGAGRLKGVIDWQRRFDHMQQHCGQHILTRSFINSSGADTVGFAIGAGHSSIELDRDTLGPKTLLAAETAANEIVEQARPITVRWREREQVESEGIRARMPPEGISTLRVVEIEGFDRTTCGGTHPANTAQVGPVRITGTERIRGRTRVFYLAGDRAHRDHRSKAGLLEKAAKELSIGEHQLLDVIRGKIQDVKDLSKQLFSLRMELSGHLAASLWDNAGTCRGVRVITHIVEEWSMAEITGLANQLVSRGKAVALIGSKGARPSLAFAASEDSGVDAGQLMRIATQAAQGKGGGTRTLARGGCPDPHRLDEALSLARSAVLES